MMFHFNSFASMLSAVTMAATSAPTHASESRHLIHDTKNHGGPMDATGDRNQFVPSKIAESYRKDMALSHQQKVQDGTLRNEDASNTSNSTPFDPSLDLGILDGKRISNDRSIHHHRKLDGLDCNGNHPLIPAEVDFAFAIEACFLSEYCPPIGCFDTSLVTDMSKALYRQREFNEDISAWVTSSVTSMLYMFYGALDFNQPVDSWDVSSVTSMEAMFFKAYAFNQPVDSWDVSSVTNMANMFLGARKFNQCLSTWADEVPPAVETNSMFMYSSCPNIGSYVGLLSYVPDPNGPWCQDADVCRVDVCENNPAPLYLQTSCEEIATLLPKTIKQLCDIGIAKDCPELCPGSEICPCADFILPFSFKEETTSCTEVAGLKEKKQKKKCNKKNIAENCPGVCTCGTF